MSTWRVRATGVGAHELGLRFTLEAIAGDRTVRVTADTTRYGSVYDLQTNECIHSTGDDSLDLEVEQCIRDALARRTVLQQLDAIDGRRWSRSDRLRRVA